MADQFYVPLMCKPYVKRFIEINFGNPADLSSDQNLIKELRRCLKKPYKKNETKYSKKSKLYTEMIQLIISSDDFYRYGWELSITDTVKFGCEIEDRAKLLMKTMVSTNNSLNGSIKMSILHFQERFSFNEDIWPYDSIKKEFFRNGVVTVIDFNDEIYNKIDHIILVNLSKKGTITPNALRNYDLGTYNKIDHIIKANLSPKRDKFAKKH